MRLARTPPELLVDMMFMMDRGFDVVYGRAQRVASGETMFKKKATALCSTVS